VRRSSVLGVPDRITRHLGLVVFAVLTSAPDRTISWVFSRTLARPGLIRSKLDRELPGLAKTHRLTAYGRGSG
jgi:hypothetical protein